MNLGHISVIIIVIITILVNVVAFHQAWLAVGWVTVRRFRSCLHHIGIYWVNSAWPFLWGRKNEYQQKLENSVVTDPKIL